MLKKRGVKIPKRSEWAWPKSPAQRMMLYCEDCQIELNKDNFRTIFIPAPTVEDIGIEDEIYLCGSCASEYQ